MIEKGMTPEQILEAVLGRRKCTSIKYDAGAI